MLLFPQTSFLKHLLSPLLTLFWLSGHGCWWKKTNKSCDNYRFILWSFIVITPVITSTLLSTSQMSQSYSLTYYSFLLETPNHLPFFCPAFLVKILLLMLQTILLKILSNSLIFSLIFSHVSVQLFWRKSPLVCGQLEGSHHDLFTLVSLMPN